MKYSAYAQYTRLFEGVPSKRIFFEASSIGNAQKVALKKLSTRWLGWTKLNFLDVQEIKLSRRLDNDNIIDIVVEESWFREFNLKIRKFEWKNFPKEHMSKISPYYIVRGDDPDLFKQAAELIK